LQMLSMGRILVVSLISYATYLFMVKTPSIYLSVGVLSSVLFIPWMSKQTSWDSHVRSQHASGSPIDVPLLCGHPRHCFWVSFGSPTIGYMSSVVVPANGDSTGWESHRFSDGLCVWVLGFPDIPLLDARSPTGAPFALWAFHLILLGIPSCISFALWASHPRPWDS